MAEQDNTGMTREQRVFADLAEHLHTAMDLAAARAAERGPHGRRFAVIAAKIEEAWLHARQGWEESNG